MFAQLLRNTAVTASAYAVISGVGLLLAPFLIATYGLAGYGQILLARMCLPNAFFGLLDLGIGENATRTVAHAQSSGNWHEGAATLTLLAVITLGLGVAVAVALFAVAAPLPRWLEIAPDEAAGFTKVLWLSAALQPVLFLSLLAEGVLKGFERFKILRSCEILSAVVYGALAVALGLGGFGANWVAASLLLALILRAVAAGVAAVILLRGTGVRWTRWTDAIRDEVVRWSRLMFGSKLLGTIQNQLAGPLIGLLLGPAAVGAYDAVVRLPRFAKTSFSLISTTVLPMATGLRSKADTAGMARLGYYGILGAFAVCAPVAIFSLVFSEPILRLWIGPEVARYWPWQSAMFVVALANVPMSFGGAMLLADRAGSQRLLRLTAFQVAFQLIGSLALFGMLQQWAFVAAQTASVVILFLGQFRLLREVLDLPLRLMAQLAVACAVSGALALAWYYTWQPANLLELAAMLAATLALSLAALPWLVLDRGERDLVHGLARRQLGR